MFLTTTTPNPLRIQCRRDDDDYLQDADHPHGAPLAFHL